MIAGIYRYFVPGLRWCGQRPSINEDSRRLPKSIGLEVAGIRRRKLQNERARPGTEPIVNDRKKTHSGRQGRGGNRMVALPLERSSDVGRRGNRRRRL